MDENSNELSSVELINQLSGETGAFDPIRFRYIQSMSRRAGELSGSISLILEEKVSVALHSFHTDYLKWKDRITTSQQINDEEPSHQGMLAQLSELINNTEKTVTSTNNLPEILDKRSAVKGELNSVRMFRESLVKLSSDKLVTRIIKEGPENPGPLNPEMLVIRSLSTMRDLSPDYLNRFVSFIDTLQWLERVDKESESKKSKKSPKKRKKLKQV